MWHQSQSPRFEGLCEWRCSWIEWNDPSYGIICGGTIDTMKKVAGKIDYTYGLLLSTFDSLISVAPSRFSWCTEETLECRIFGGEEDLER